jgi:hypothetical protein
MKLAAIATVIGLGGVVSAAPQRTIDLLNEIYPSDFIKRQVLNLCITYDLGFNRFSTMSREECYRTMPKGALENAHPRVGLAANQFDLRRAADLHGAPRNDIRVIEATEAIRGGVSQ